MDKQPVITVWQEQIYLPCRLQFTVKLIKAKDWPAAGFERGDKYRCAGKRRMTWNEPVPLDAT